MKILMLTGLFLILTNSAFADIILGNKVYKCDGVTNMNGDKVYCNGLLIKPETPSGKIRKIKSSDECSTFISANGVITCDGEMAEFVRDPNTVGKIPKECYLLQTSFLGCDDLKRYSNAHKQCCRFEDIDSSEEIYRDHSRFNSLLKSVFQGLDEVTLPASKTKSK